MLSTLILFILSTLQEGFAPPEEEEGAEYIDGGEPEEF